MVLKLRYDAPQGWADAKCQDYCLTHSDDPFFAEDEHEKQHAVDFCNGTADGIVCPIRQKCLLFALVNNEKDGVWGGAREITRKAIRRKYPPLKGGKARDEWYEWKTESEWLSGLDPELLALETEKE